MSVRGFGDIYDTVDDFFSGVFGPKQGKVDEGNQRAENECFSQNTVVGVKIKDLEFKKYTNNNIVGMVKLSTDDYLIIMIYMLKPLYIPYWKI